MVLFFSDDDRFFAKFWNLKFLTKFLAFTPVCRKFHHQNANQKYATHAPRFFLTGVLETTNLRLPDPIRGS